MNALSAGRTWKGAGAVSEKMTTSEPTTGEIVSALRNCPNCDDCLRKDQKCYRNNHDAADRLESQEQTISALTARAEQAERERDAAKADMKLIVDAERETHCDETCCFACKHDCDMSINDSGEFNNECPGFYKDDCFEWRGAREGEGK